MSKKNLWTRRRMLSTLGLGAGGFLLRDVFFPAKANAETTPLSKRPLFVFAYFSGGWDTLLSLDPRDNTKYKESDKKTIVTAFERVEAVSSVLADPKVGMSGIVKAGNIDFGPAIGRLASEHFNDLCVIRGIDMNTLTHEAGRRYFLTGKTPRGLSASGSALPTWIVQDDPQAAIMPNLVMGTFETYNEGLDPRATGLSIREIGDLETVLKSLYPTKELNSATQAALVAHLGTDHCIHKQIDGLALNTAYRAAAQNAEILAKGDLWSYFDFNTTPNASIQKLYDAFGISTTKLASDLSGPKGRVATAAQALTNGFSQAVSIVVAGNLDSHGEEWETEHAPLLTAGFDAISDLISYLQATEDTENPGQSFWNRTTLLCFSEFSRTPNINVRGGRDHHLYNACLVAGNGIKGNQVIGATHPDEYTSMKVNLTTGQVDQGGVALRPPDVHATVLEAMGLSYEHISNQDPKIIQAMLK